MGNVNPGIGQDLEPNRIAMLNGRLRRVTWLAVGMFVTVIVLSVILWQAKRPKESVAKLDNVTTTHPTESVTKLDATKVYRDDVVPLLDRFDKRNEEAAARAVANMHERINCRRSGIPLFIDDISSWGTRFGVVGKMSNDLWQKYWNKQPNVDALNSYVNAKFRHYVLSEEALTRDVGMVMDQFMEDIDASRNTLYVELRQPLQKIKSPAIRTEASFDAFRADMQRRAADQGKRIGADASTDSLLVEFDKFIAGGVSMNVAQGIASRVVAAVLARVGSQLAVNAAEIGGATAAGAATGAGGGSFGGPAGTIIGLAVGLAAGCVVDWWMEKDFKSKMSDRLNKFFDVLDQNLIKGTEQSPGLDNVLKKAVKRGDEGQRQVVIKFLEGVQQ